MKLLFVKFGISCSFGSWISRHAERFEESDGGRMEVVVNEEKSVLVLFLCSQVTRHLLDYLFLCSTILDYFASFLFCLHLVAFGEI